MRRLYQLFYTRLRLLPEILERVDWGGQRWLQSVAVGMVLGFLIPAVLAVYFVFRA